MNRAIKLKQYQVDAFTDRLFAGNPAAVCPLDKWLSAATMQAIAAENNLSETAFSVPSEKGFELRWFTPTDEVDLCGHATLAAAHIIFQRMNYAQCAIVFATRRGDLIVEQDGDYLKMSFPSIQHHRFDPQSVFPLCESHNAGAALA